MAKSTQTIVSNWQKGMAGAGPAYQAGTQAVQESPMAKAATKLDKAAQNYMEAVSSGRMAAALLSVPLSTWKAQCAAGASKLTSGAAKGLNKYQAGIQALQPVYAAMRDAADSAPDDPIAKSNAALQVMLDYKRNKTK